MSAYSHHAGEARAGRALQQPLRDLSIVRDEIPGVLKEARLSPYRLPDSGEDRCAEVRREIGALDAVMGPDIDSAEAPGQGGVVLSSVVGSVVNLPFRGVVRFVTGASRRDRDLGEALRAGAIRRGFLKGVATSFCGGKPGA